MTANPGDAKKCCWLIGLAGRLYSVAAVPGWRRRLLFAASAFILALAVRALWGGNDYRTDPSFLAPRSVATYVEVRDLAATLQAMNGWQLWTDASRGAANGLQADLAGALGNLIPRLGARQALAWLTMTEHAAFAKLTDDETGEQSWSISLAFPEPEAMLNELAVDPRLSLTPAGRDGAYSISGGDEEEAPLHVAVAGSWLMLSSSSVLPEFALNSIAKPALSLGGAGILPEWARDESIRMAFSAGCGQKDACPFWGIFNDRLNPKARIALAVRLDENGLAASRSQVAVISEMAAGHGGRAFWSVFLAVVALMCAAVILLILLMAIGWGGWLKVMAMRSGVACSDALKNVEPSDAFKTDSGETVPAGGDKTEKQSDS